MAGTRIAKPVERFSVYWVLLDPTVGHEIQKTRPCLVISPNDLNDLLGTVIIAPLTPTRRDLPSRVASEFKHNPGEIALDQMRCVDKSRLGKRIGAVDQATAEKTLSVLAEMFAW